MLDKGSEIEGDIGGSPGCVGGSVLTSRVEAPLGTGIRDDNDDTVAVGNNSQRILPTLTGTDPFLRLFLREAVFREREGESGGACNANTALERWSKKWEEAGEFNEFVIPEIRTKDISIWGTKKSYVIIRGRTT